MNVRRNTLCLSVALFGTIWLMDVYLLYYIKVFLDKFHLEPSYLNNIQILFLIWNAINDPILGFVQDLGCCGITWIQDRRKVVLYCGPVFSIAFLLFWFPWSSDSSVVIGIQLLVSLFIFDTLLTLVLSAYCGLCVEKCQKHQDRVRIIVYGELVGVVAGFLIMPMESLTDNLEKFDIFQIFTVGIALLSAACLFFCGLYLKDDQTGGEEEMKKLEETEELGSDWRSVLTISWQIIKEFRFIALVGAQFFKILRFMGNEQFLIIFVEALLTNHGLLERGSNMLGFYYVLARSLGNILFLALWVPVNKLGCQWVIQGINIVSLFNCAFAYMAGSNNFWAIAIFIVIENTLCRCGWQGFYMVISGEVIDSDKIINKRKSPLSTTIFTMKALFTKPADQLAPVILLAFLQTSYYNEFKSLCWPNEHLSTLNPGNMTISSTISPTDLDLRCTNIRLTTFQALIFFPIICCIGESLFVLLDQYVVWKSGNDTRPAVNETENGNIEMVTQTKMIASST
ncbi:unnamed protein product [Auanema sp. JU1783]|nr:unnamed protein product [Auanema sp. JU1783]